MSGYLQRLASSALNPGGSIRPMLGSVFSFSTYRGARDDMPGEGRVSALLRPELVKAPPITPIPPLAGPKPEWSGSSAEPFREEKTSFRPLVNQGQQREFEKPVAPSMGMNHEAAGWDESENVVSSSTPETATPGGHASPIQSAGRELGPSLSGVSPLRSMSFASSSALRDGSKELVSEQRSSAGASAGALVTEAQPADVERPEAADKGRYQPLLPANLSRTDHPLAFGEPSSRLTPEVRENVRRSGGKEESRDLSRRSGSPEREPDEIQIHIGRIEITAMTQPAPRPLAAPVHKSPSLDEYLKRRDGRTG